LTIHDILPRLRGVKGGQGQWTALCPAHQDTRNSLSISTGQDGRILFHCHAGCSVEAIAGALGLSVKDLFEDKSRSKPQIEAVYTYPSGAQSCAEQISPSPGGVQTARAGGYTTARVSPIAST